MSSVATAELEGPGTGGANVFAIDGSGWVMEGSLFRDTYAFDSFGRSLAFAGEPILVGTNAGSPGSYGPLVICAFHPSNGVWSQVARMTFEEGSGGLGFSRSTDIDGDTADLGGHRGRFVGSRHTRLQPR